MYDSESNEGVHELSYYAKDKVKLMKEVLKIIKPKKIKAMAPNCIKHFDIIEINSMLLEELLGISNKRLQYIFKGENADRETSSSESDDEKGCVDIISLDDISDDDFDACDPSTSQDTSRDKKSKPRRNKKHDQVKATIDEKKEIRKEKQHDKCETKRKTCKETEKNKLMNVLELLELQARARAIRSQLALENTNKNKVTEKSSAGIKRENDSDSDAIIVDSPTHNEIVITSESEQEQNETKVESPVKRPKTNTPDKTEFGKFDLSELDIRKQKLLTKLQKIKLNRSRNFKINTELSTMQKMEDTKNKTIHNSKTSQAVIYNSKPINEKSNFCDDGIVINLDEDEIVDIENN
ncbi:hypothetical protein FQA39_LY01609 [Lamprigera yunnana]|nr:hypothetical protein FQA39_LY01609 [Lamprigera yunnana]